MSKTNVRRVSEPVFTHEGGKASKISKIKELERTVMSCLLWEDEFYEDGVKIADRIRQLINECKDTEVIELIKKVKFEMRIRHCPLWMIVCLVNKGVTGLKDLIASVLQRPDDMGELVSLYYTVNDSTKPLANSIKKGIAKAFEKFDEYQLGKYNRNVNYKLVDLVNLCHPKPTEAINKLINGTLETPDTWEVGMSKAGQEGTSKADVWNRLIANKKLPDMAFLKNIRGILESGVSTDIVKTRIASINQKKLLPIDFIRAGQNNPSVESEVEDKLLNFYDTPALKGKTALLIDVSGSMYGNSYCGDRNERQKYANALAMIGREACEDVYIYSFSNDVKVVPNRHGFALAEAINTSQDHRGTYMWKALNEVNSKGYDRIIVVTDEQTQDSYSKSVLNGNVYIVNIASYQRGVGYNQNITHINGTSDRVFNYIEALENEF